MNNPLSLSFEVKDTLLELVNIGVGRAASGLSELTGKEVTISVPELETFHCTEPQKFPDIVDRATLRVSQSFCGGFAGHALMILNRGGAIQIANLLLGKESGDEAFDENEQSAMLELGNIVIGNVVGILATQLDVEIKYQLPQVQLRGITNLVDLFSDLADPASSSLLIMKASLTIKEDKVSGYLMLVLNTQGFVQITRLLENLLRA